MSLKFAANLSFLFTETNIPSSPPTIAERLRLAHANGFKAVEIPYPRGHVSEVVKAKKETGIEVVLVNLAYDDSNPNILYGSTSVPGEENNFEQQLNDTIDFAKMVQCDKIHITAGILRTGMENKYLATYKSNLKLAAKYLETANLTGVIEPINKYSIPLYFLNTYEKAFEVLSEVNSKNLKLMIDVFHLQHICGNVTNILTEFKSFIGHIQIAQVPNRCEPDTFGELNFSYIFEKIKESGYDGWIGCEYKPKATTVEGLKWLKKYGLEL